MGRVDDLAAQFQAALESESIAAVRTMTDALARALPGLVADAERAAQHVIELKAAGKNAEAATFAATRARAIARQVEAEVRRLTAQLAPGLLNGQQAAVEVGLAAAEALTNAVLPEGVTLASVGVSWTRANLDAVRRLVGTTGPGSPLADLLDQVAPDAGRRVRETLTRGLLRGSNPRVVGRDLGREVALPAIRAETIARDQMNRAYRGASQAAYEANADVVKGFRRLATKSNRTCPMCLALDGKRQATQELMAVHVQDRCTVVPVLDIPGIDETPAETGAQWFASQPPDVQEHILGPGGYRKFKSGAPLSSFVDEHDDPTWGPTLRRRPNSEVAA